MKKNIILLIAILLLSGCNCAFKKDNTAVYNPKVLSLDSSQETAKTPASSEMPAETKIPEFIDLKTPFVSQAPLNNWDNLHNEACEEASVLSVIAGLENQSLSRDEMDKEIIKMVDWQMDYFGGHYDLPINNVEELIEKYYNNKYNVQIIENPSMDNIKKELASGNPLIIPASGRTLANPHYTGLGPVYHMLVIRGYDENTQEFITNDVGTHHTGDSYRFKMSIVFDAIHDMPAWGKQKNDLDRDPNMIFEGRKVVIIVEKSIVDF